MRTSHLIADLELCALVRPTGRVLLAGQILPRDGFPDLSGDMRLWMRLAEPEDTGLEGPRIEFAAATRRDEAAGTARVIARAAPANPSIARSVFKFFQIQGMTDLLLVGPTPPVGSCGELIHEIACADLTRWKEEFGQSTRNLPKRYV